MCRTAAFHCAVLAALSAANGQWPGPYQLTTSPGADVNPSACKEWVQGEHTCLVWQTDRNGNWDVRSRCCVLCEGNGWLGEKPVVSTGFDEVNPAVCAVFDARTWPVRNEFWCAWERRDNPDFTTIWAALGDTAGWMRLDSLASTANGPLDSAGPSVICINGWLEDSVWAVWQDVGTSGYRIDAVCFDYATMAWSDRMTIHAAYAPKHHVRVGRRGGWSTGERPFVVWEQNGEILWSEFRHGVWTAADTVAPSPARDCEPDIISYMPSGMPCGPWITWTSERDGDTAVFGTPCDTFDVARRWSDTTNAGRNWSPCGTVMYMTVDWEPFLGLCVSDRRGNPDIYSVFAYDFGDGAVDTSPATDLNPTLTTLGYADATTLCWACWQSDRDGDWNIYGSFLYNTGVAEPGSSGEDGVTRYPSVIRGVLWLRDCHLGSPWETGGCTRAELLDAAGRMVAELHAGENDIRHLAPGVYFVREHSAFSTQHSGPGVMRDASRVTKVIIPR